MVYRVIQTKIRQSNGNTSIAYGIGCRQGQIECLSPDRNRVAALALLFNENRLDPAHLRDCCDDFLYACASGCPIG